jgi:hypothetical protein
MAEFKAYKFQKVNNKHKPRIHPNLLLSQTYDFFNQDACILFNLECNKTFVLNENFQFISNNTFTNTFGGTGKNEIADIN